MGALCSCTSKKSKRRESESRASLRAGGRIQVQKNKAEDPHAPFMTKSYSNQIDNDILDADLDRFIQGLSSDDGVDPNDEEIEKIINA